MSDTREGILAKKSPTVDTVLEIAVGTSLVTKLTNASFAESKPCSTRSLIDLKPSKSLLGIDFTVSRIVLPISGSLYVTKSTMLNAIPPTDFTALDQSSPTFSGMLLTNSFAPDANPVILSHAPEATLPTKLPTLDAPLAIADPTVLTPPTIAPPTVLRPPAIAEPTVFNRPLRSVPSLLNCFAYSSVVRSVPLVALYASVAA